MNNEEGEIIDFVQILPDAFTRDMVLVDMYCLEIEQILADKVIKITKEYIDSQLRPQYTHLKRCRSTKDFVEILIGPKNQIPHELLQQVIELRKNTMIDINTSDQMIKIKKIRAAKFAPLTRKQYNEEGIFWPLYFKKPSLEVVPLTDEEKKHAIQFLNYSIQIGKEFGTCEGGCVLTFQNNIVGISGDNRKNHPLHHAGMLAIEMVAYKLRNGIKEKYKQNRIISNHTNKTTCKEHKLSVEEGNKQTNINSDIIMDQYLCTNYFAYFSHEPCLMCAMAMVHSRVKCIIFDKTNINNGALCSKLKIHSIKNLNHHFKVYKSVRKKSNLF